MNIEKIAEICHEANRILCAVQGDFSQTSWDNAPRWQKQSAINGVKYAVEFPEATPKDLHNNWLLDKKNDGWKYGEVKDPEKKEHPCFVSYDKLPQKQQVKDYLFHNICKSLIPLLDLKDDSLEGYLKAENSQGKSEFRVVAAVKSNGETEVYIHPLNKNGRSMLYQVSSNQLKLLGSTSPNWVAEDAV